MQAELAVPSKWNTEVFRRRGPVLAECPDGQAESVAQLIRSSALGSRSPWALPGIELGRRPNKRREDVARWPFRITPTLVLLFLGWLIEGALKPRRKSRGLVAWGQMRWVIGRIGGKPGDDLRDGWTGLLGCSRKTFQRLVRELEALGLVEQQRLVIPTGKRSCDEVPAAYRPGPVLLDWANGTVPQFGTRLLPSGVSPLSQERGDIYESSLGEVTVSEPEGMESPPVVATQKVSLARARLMAAVEAAPLAAEMLPVPAGRSAGFEGDGLAPVAQKQPATLRLVAQEGPPEVGAPPGDRVTREDLRELAARLFGKNGGAS